MSARGVPQLQIEVDGADANELRAVSEVTIFRALSQPSQCELTLRGPQGPLGRGQSPLGRALRVGVEGHSEAAFEGEVTAVDHEYDAGGLHTLHVRAYDRLHRLRKRQPVRAHTDVCAQTLAERLVADLGLSVEAARPGPHRRLVIQHRTSDLQLLIAEAARAGLYLSLVDRQLRLVGLEGHGELEGHGAPQPLHLGKELLKVSIEVNTEAALRRVEANAWNMPKALPLRVVCDTPPIAPNLETRIEQTGVGGTGARTLTLAAASTLEQAEACAEALLEHGHAVRAIVRGTCEGNPALHPGLAISLQGVAAELEGTYVLTEVRHRVDSQAGFVTEISTAPPPPLSAGAETVTLLAVVSAVDDPDDRGRLRACLPSVGEIETDWMPVCLPGAGAGKGLVALPELGDSILVLAESRDLTRAVVLGGLFGDAAPPKTARGSAPGRRLSLTTADGQRLLLDSTGKSLRIDDGNGSSLRFGPGGVRLSSNTDLVIEAPGKSLTLRAAAIDFERA